MKLWLRKLSVVLITFMTLGIYIPPTYLDDLTDSNEYIESSSNSDESLISTRAAVDKQTDVDAINEVNIENNTSDHFIGLLTEQAKGQTTAKLGPKIVNKVEDEFNDVILPSMESVIRGILVEAGDEELPYYGISEQPAQGIGERIFNIYNFKTSEDVAKFHVRRDKRPQEGYYFNFHYHLSTDGFEEHYDIGEIYWDKNTPPKWMA